MISRVVHTKVNVICERERLRQVILIKYPDIKFISLLKQVPSTVIVVPSCTKNSQLTVICKC